MGGYMSFEEKYEFHMLKNEMEVLVIRELERQLNSGNEGMCRCKDCVLDVAAIALNNIKPLYRISLLGTLYASQAISDKNITDSVMNVVHQAIKKVTDNPAHD